ncbi:energy-coupling factor transporter transmembrane component T family protein [Brevibacillus sp. B_LB10_24]|uniref:energy-coupling factor transporter transmembrane component T family protein n=1 Tax=Brevibacillus sp. B_LB10_24 TaxID=3380645 RepID=UPI0038B90C18
MRLQEINPSVKAGAVVIAIILLAFAFDPVTPLLVLLGSSAAACCFGGVSVRKWLLCLSPFLLIAIGYVWSAMLFGRVPSGANAQILWSFGPLQVTAAGVSRGISLGLRVLSFAALSLLFVLTTSPSRFMFSLMQQCRVSPKIAYGILAGYRFLPLLKEELALIRTAHRIRRMGVTGSWADQVKQLGGYVIPLLASAIRKAERTAMAMESKGFTGSRQRAFYQRLSVTAKDWLFLAAVVAFVLAGFFVSDRLGQLHWYSGEL